jgi:hypothetical protein
MELFHEKPPLAHEAMAQASGLVLAKVLAAGHPSKLVQLA